jgi:hypothetical protein
MFSIRPSSETWRVKYEKAVECLIKDRDAARLLRLPGQALEAPENDQHHRKLVRHHPPPNRSVESMPLEQDRARMIFKLAEAAEKS